MQEELLSCAEVGSCSGPGSQTFIPVLTPLVSWGQRGTQEGLLQNIIGSGGDRVQQFQKSHSYGVLVDPCQKAKHAEHARVPPGFIKESSSLGFTGISTV